MRYAVLKLFVARRPGDLKKMTHGVSEYDQGFNTVSVMMNPKHLDRFAFELETMVWDSLIKKNEKIFVPKDIFYTTYCERYKLKQNAVEPVIFQHVGLFSSLGTRTVDKQFVSTTWFLNSKFFNSDGIPILFNSTRWSIL